MLYPEQCSAETVEITAIEDYNISRMIASFLGLCHVFDAVNGKNVLIYALGDESQDVVKSMISMVSPFIACDSVTLRTSAIFSKVLVEENTADFRTNMERLREIDPADCKKQRFVFPDVTGITHDSIPLLDNTRERVARKRGALIEAISPIVIACDEALDYVGVAQKSVTTIPECIEAGKRIERRKYDFFMEHGEGQRLRK